MGEMSISQRAFTAFGRRGGAGNGRHVMSSSKCFESLVRCNSAKRVRTVSGVVDILPTGSCSE